MLEITVPGGEYYDSANNVFISYKPVTLQLEHSLLSISKWESKTHKAFLSKADKTNAEIIEYIRCMTMTPGIESDVYTRLTQANVDAVVDYIKDPMSATKLKHDNGPSSREILTSELIYYYMVAAQIPFECQKWHLNRLINLIEIYSKKSNPKKKTQAEVIQDYKKINAENRARFSSKG